MPAIWTMGEMLVEIMRPRPDMPLGVPAEFVGPFPSGAPAIFIDTVAKLGFPAGIVGGVGNDDFGDLLRQRLMQDGVDCRFISIIDGISTGVAFVTYFKDGSRKFIYHIGNTPAAMSKAPDLADIKDVAYFHLMGCSLLANSSFRSEIVTTLENFVAKGAKVSFDPNIRLELLGNQTLSEVVDPVMKHCAVLQPGVEELLMLAGVDSVEQAVERLFCNPKLEIIALKRGKKGCSIFTRGEKIDLGVYNIIPLDPTGAGDAFDAGFLCGLVSGRSIKDSAALATAAASLNTAAFGPMEGAINRESVETMLHSPLV